MSRNGSGTYSLPAGNPVSGGTVISSTWANSTLSDIATALTQSIAKDGQTVPTANLPMGTYKHTNVAVGAALTDYARYDQLQNSAPQWLTSVSGADTITASAPVAPSAYAAGQTFRFVSAGANTGAVTLNVNSLGAKDVTKNGTTALTAGDIASGAVVTVTYDGTRFQVASSSSVALAGNNTWTGTNTFRNSAGIRSEQAATQDAIVIAGRAGGTGSYEVTITPTTLTAGRTATYPDGSGTVVLNGVNSAIVSGTAVASTSGASIDFTGIPSWVRRITVMFSGVSTDAAVDVCVRIGPVAGVETTGYSGVVQRAAAFTSLSTYIDIDGGYLSAGAIRYGILTLALLDSSTNLWAFSGTIGNTAAPQLSVVSGTKALAGTLSKLSVIPSGVANFDAGTINIMYE